MTHESYVWMITKDHGFQCMGPIIVHSDKDADALAKKISDAAGDLGISHITGSCTSSYVMEYRNAQHSQISR